MVPVVHYAEGSLMPALALKLTFSMIPERAPLLLQPLLRGIFDALISRLTLPRLRIHADFVSTISSSVLPADSRYVADRNAPK